MPAPDTTTILREWAERFRSQSLAARVVTDLREREVEIWRGTFELLTAECPEYRNAIDDEFQRESKRHCADILKLIIAIATGGLDRLKPDPFGFVRTHAQWRARHHVPLTASLHAYRLAHKQYWTITRQGLSRCAKREGAMASALMLSGFWIEYFDVLGGILTDTHIREEQLIIARSTRAHQALIENFLRGAQAGDLEAQQLATLCGFRPGMKLAVIVARPVQPRTNAQSDLKIELRSVARLIEQTLPVPAFGRLIDTRNDDVTAIICHESAAAAGAVEALAALRGDERHRVRSAVAIGVSLDASDVAHVPQALEEAQLALEFASTQCPLVHFADINLPDFLVRRAERAALRLIPAWAHHLGNGADGKGGDLTRTIRAFADCNFNVKQTARELGLHTNSVYFRLNRINELTGVDPRTYSGTTLLLTTLRLLELHEGKLSG